MTPSAEIALLSLPVLLLGALVALVLPSNRTRAAAALGSQAIAAVLVLSTTLPLLAGAPALAAEQPWPRPIGSIAFRIDALGAFFLAWSLPMTLLGTIYATGYLRPYFAHKRNGGPHFALLNLVSLSFVLVYTVQNALVFLLGWEIAAVAAWLLVIWDYRSQKVRFAGFNYLVSTHVGLFILVAAFMLMRSATDSIDFEAFGAFLSVPGPRRATIFLLLCASFALKSAFFPFHTWLPRAHAAAPAHVSALMSGVIHKAGIYGFLRFTLLLGRPEPWMGWTVLAFGLLSALFGAVYTSVQRDLKRLLGYSSTENVGIAAAGFGVGYLGWSWGEPALAICGFAGGLMHVLNHALFKCLLFYGAGAVQRVAHTVDLERLGGLAKRVPLTAALFLAGAVASSGLPPLNGFVSEFLIYAGLLSGRMPTGQDGVALVAAAATLAFVGAVSALSMTRAFGTAFLGTTRDPMLHVGGEARLFRGPPAAPPETGWQMLIPMALHAAGIAAVGLAPGLGLAAVAATMDLFPFSAAPAGEQSHLLAVLTPAGWASRALAVALLIGGWARWRQGSLARSSVTWGCGYTAPSARMQYTGSSFSEPFARIFEPLLPSLRRERIPPELFPAQPGELATHHPDAVERRIFEVLRSGEDLVAQAAGRMREQPRFAFGAGMIALLLIGALILGGGTR